MQHIQIGERWRTVVWVALLAQIPFELKQTFLGLSNLQWTFVVLVTLSVPFLYANRQYLRSDHTVRAAILFVAVQWGSAAYAPDFNGNAYKAAIRFTAGLLLLAMARVFPNRISILRIWTAASVLAALYALVDQAGLGLPGLFRDSEFFIAQVQRLSGSFEYPNIAAAYFAMSLPLVWWSPLRPAFRWSAAIVLWCALILTFSRAAAGAVIIVSIAEAALLWKKKGEWQFAVKLVGAAIVASIITVPLTPYMIDVLKRSAPANPPAAQYSTAWNLLRQQPNTRDEIQLSIRNVGTIPWLARGSGRVALGYKWRNRESGKFERGSLITNLPHDVQPGETIELPAKFETPESPGEYSLIIELFVRDFDWFSNADVIPAVIVCEIQPGTTRSVEQVDLPALRLAQSSLTQPVPRSGLWRAAFQMFLAHPFGVGPDNYRLLYGRFLNLTRWNTNIYSNSLYLELLSGSGILGLTAFGLIILSIRRDAATACFLAVAVFLVHGFLDVFLMTTPIYFSFWILAGIRRV